MHVEYWLQAATFTRVICTTMALLLPPASPQCTTHHPPHGQHGHLEPATSHRCLGLRCPPARTKPYRVEKEEQTLAPRSSTPHHSEVGVPCTTSPHGAGHRQLHTTPSRAYPNLCIQGR